MKIVFRSRPSAVRSPGHAKIKREDEVIVIAGKDKGKRGQGPQWSWLIKRLLDLPASNDYQAASPSLNPWLVRTAVKLVEKEAPNPRLQRGNPQRRD